MGGFWVRTSVKDELTKKEKRLIGRHSSPRWELDIVGYSGRENLLRVVESKSFLDSVGVRACAFDGSDPEEAKRYKLANESELRRIVFNRLCLQFTEAGACLEVQVVFPSAYRESWARTPRPFQAQSLACYTSMLRMRCCVSGGWRGERFGSPVRGS
jgi:hypothetical protein